MSTTTLARAWAVSRSDGLSLGFTDHDRPLQFEGMIFRPDSGLSARAVVQGAGLAVDNTEAEGGLSDDAITEPDLMAGRWDGAEVRLWEVDWARTQKRRLLFRGTLGEVTRQGHAFRAELRGLGEALNRPLGRVYHPRCSAVLGDAQCAKDLNAPGYAALASIRSASEGQVFALEGLTGFDQRWFERGTLTVTSGAAKGLTGVIKRDVATPAGDRKVELWAGLGQMPIKGDMVRLTAGCDKRGETCRLKFNNYLNFRGFPHLPSEDWLIAPQAAGNRLKR